MKYYLKLLAIPLLFFVLYIVLFIIWQVFSLPPAEELAKIVKDGFEQYGLPVLFISSIVEGMLLVGNYFPGVFVIFIGVILAQSVWEATVVVFVVTIALFLAHIGNYLLGRYGWYTLLVKFGLKNAIDEAEQKLLKRGPVAIFSSYWLPSVGALTDTAAGIIRMPFKKFMFYSLISTIFWDAFAGVVVYTLGEAALTIASPGSSGMITMFSIIVIWIIILLILDFREKRKEINIL